MTSSARPGDSLRILLASPRGWATDALRGMLERILPLSDVEFVHDIQHLLSEPLPSRSAPDFMLLDADNLTMEPIMAICGILQRWPTVQVVVLGARVEDGYVDAILGAGALSYLPKSHSQTVMSGVLRLMLGGEETQPSTTLANSCTAKTSTPTEMPQREYGLTNRQTEVLALAAQGKTNLAIAKQLGITEGVVKLHMSAIFKALGVQNRSEAILMASRLQSVNVRQIRQAEDGSLDLEWLLPYMSHRHLAQDTVIFRKGEAGKELFYLQRGAIRLREINAEIHAGTMFGEIGIFSPSHQRTSTAVCASDVDLFTLSSDQVKRLYLLNPQFALFTVHLIARRLMADQARTV